MRNLKRCATALAATALIFCFHEGNTLQASTVGYTLIIEDLRATGIEITNNPGCVSTNSSGPIFTIQNDATSALIDEFEFTIGNTSFMFDEISRLPNCLVGALVDPSNDLACTVVVPPINVNGDNIGPDLFKIDCTGFDPGDKFFIGTADVDTDNTNDVVTQIVFWDNGIKPNSVATVRFSGGQELAFTFPENQQVENSCPSGDPWPGTTCQSVTISQSVTVPPSPVALDIRPESCPNPLNTRYRGVLPVAVVGGVDFDVNDVDTDTLRLEGIAPLRHAFEDVATPFLPFTGKELASDCTEDGPDGVIDLMMHFSNQQIVGALGAVARGEVIVLELTGMLTNGEDILSEDVMIVRR